MKKRKENGIVVAAAHRSVAEFPQMWGDVLGKRSARGCGGWGCRRGRGQQSGRITANAKNETPTRWHTDGAAAPWSGFEVRRDSQRRAAPRPLNNYASVYLLHPVAAAAHAEWDGHIMQVANAAEQMFRLDWGRVETRGWLGRPRELISLFFCVRAMTGSSLGMLHVAARLLRK